MKPGTPGFVGDRLREARDARGVTAVTLADLIEVTRQAVSLYESNRQTPSPETMTRIAEVLKLPRHFFLKEARQKPASPFFYRSQSSATKSARVRAESRFFWFQDVVEFIGRYVKLPVSNLPSIEVPVDFRSFDSAIIEDAATQTRRHWGLGNGPISNLVLLFENNGIVVARHELAAETLDAFSPRKDAFRFPFIVLGIDKSSAVRSRFDAAHELAHLILHQNVTEKDLLRKDSFSVIEEQANRFASAFLLPAETFAQDLGLARLDSMRALKSKWRVSIGAMVHRASQLAMVSPDEARRLWINRTQRGWRLREPLDDELDFEEPRVLKKSFELVLSKGIISPDEICQETGLDLGEIEKLCGFEVGYLSGKEVPAELNPVILNFNSARRA